MAEMRAKLGLDNAEWNTGLTQAQVKLKEFNMALAQPGAGLASFARNLPMIGLVFALFETGVGTVKAFAAGLQSAFGAVLKRQELVADMQAFYGSVEASTAKLKEAASYARGTHFDTSEVAETALRLDVMTNGALRGAAALHLIGDAATATDTDFQRVGTTLGLLYLRISSGGALERPMLALEKMGVITPVVSAKIKGLVAAGESTDAIWKVVTASMERFKGTTENVADTAGGSLLRIKKNINAIFLALSMPVVEALTPWLRRVADQIDHLRGNVGSFKETWTNFIVGSMSAWYMFSTGARRAISDVKELRERIIEATVSWAAYLEGAAGAGKQPLIHEIAEKRIAKIRSEQTAGDLADAKAAAEGIAAVIKNSLPPAPSTVSNNDDDGDDAPSGKEIKSKQQELADLEASAHEKGMSALEKINDLEARRNDLLAKAAWWKEHIATLDPAHDQGAIAVSQGEMLENQIAAAKLAEQIGQTQETRDQKIAELKQKILERADKLLDKEARIAALREEESKLDLNNADEELRLTAAARKGEIEDEIKVLQEKHPPLSKQAATGQIIGQGGGGRQGGKHYGLDNIGGAGMPSQDKDGVYRGWGMFGARGKGHHTMGELAGSAGKGLPTFKTSGIGAIKPPDDVKKQTVLQAKMEGHLKIIATHVTKSGGGGGSIPMARFGN